MDFYKIGQKETKDGHLDLFPQFVVGRVQDLMVRGRSFYAIWDEEKGMWSTDEYDVPRLVDAEMWEHARTLARKTSVRTLKNFGTNSWANFKAYLRLIDNNSHDLDQRLTFRNTQVKKSDYVSKRLNYDLAPGSYDAWDELVGTLYSGPEREKIEWAIGSIIAGDSTKIQKFVVLYGLAGSGKGTILNIIERLFPGYVEVFEAKALGSSNGQFATEAFKNNPLVAIQYDGDLSRIDDNTKLNTIIAHERMTINEKFKSAYSMRVNAFLFMGTNKPVKITDAKSGIIRRLIDVHPTGVVIPINHYETLMSKIDFELGAIAHHCHQVYLRLGPNHYNSYRPTEMMLQTDSFFNFIEAYYDVFKRQDGASLAQGYILYKEYCTDSNISRVMPRYKFRDEFRNYFDEFKTRAIVEGEEVRSYYQGFNADKFKAPLNKDQSFSLVMEETESVMDDILKDMPAQMANRWETPRRKWDAIATTLADIDTSKLHFVKVPPNHIVIDFDLKGENGEKSLERNLAAASNWPPTYAELSKSGDGVHLHYIYDGDPTTLQSTFSDGIEIKTYPGDASLRRQLTKCNNVAMTTLTGGLPLKEKKDVLETKVIQSEKGLRDLIARNLRKEIHPHTKSSVDFIKKILDEAYESGMTYDVTDLRGRILVFAQRSTNQPLAAIKTVQHMRFKSADVEEKPEEEVQPVGDKLTFFDLEVFPNLFAVCWKVEGSDQVVRMVNPTQHDVEGLLKMRLVGFFNRHYDNHIIYARYMGYDNAQLYALSQKLVVDKDKNATFGEAYKISYADIHDFSSKKQSLKRWQIDLGIPHKELNLPWDQPVAEEDISKVLEYCENDVRASEAVFNDRRQDFVARQILADLSGLTVNDTTARHTARIIFGNDRNPRSSFVYTDLSKDFPGYLFDLGKSYYREELVGEGGYVYAEPGMYEDVAVLDIASMHPTSIVQLNLFGEYTRNFTALRDARIAIKHKDYATARKMLDGKLAPHLKKVSDADALAYALKIVINIVYGLTSAKFDNPFRDMRNKDNIVAKRGALFMIDLKHAVQEQGFQVVHIKTDSIKIPNATPEIIEFIINFGKKYGYDFEHEDTYSRFCLVNDAVYIAKKADGKWEAVGAQFQHPFVYKTLFTHEPIDFDDLCETKQVSKGAMYIHFDHDVPETPPKEAMTFIGRSGMFVPVQEGQGGGILYRMSEDKPFAVTGTKGYLWVEAHVAKEFAREVDMRYFERLADKAAETIWKYGNYDWFVSQEKD